ncbi:hypothetical protein BJ165DRAFT_1535239 [Panaeolus papilionaceus]|nr:hypothetical protein BJ165DRAFT_1535239 [Panaeolus papilionaceus]
MDYSRFPSILRQVLELFDPELDVYKSIAHTPYGWGVQMVQESLLPLLLVNKAWRDVCEGKSSLWTAIALPPVTPINGQTVLDFLRRRIQLSGTRTVAIQLDLQEATATQVHAFIKELQCASIRIQVLQIGLRRPGDLLTLFDKEFSHLKTLLFICSDAVVSRTLSRGQMNSQNMKCLQGFPCWNLPVISGLVSVSPVLCVPYSRMFSNSTLVNLHFRSIDTGCLINILQYSPRLEAVTVDYSVTKDMAEAGSDDMYALHMGRLVHLDWNAAELQFTSIHRIELPFLINLRLYDAYMLPNLEVPSLECLYIHYPDQNLCLFFDLCKPRNLVSFGVSALSLDESLWWDALSQMVQVRIFDVDIRAEDCPYFATEWLTNDNLHQVYQFFRRIESFNLSLISPPVPFDLPMRRVTSPFYISNEHFFSSLASLLDQYQPQLTECNITGGFYSPFVPRNNEASWHKSMVKQEYGPVFLDGDKFLYQPDETYPLPLHEKLNKTPFAPVHRLYGFVPLACSSSNATTRLKRGILSFEQTQMKIETYSAKSFRNWFLMGNNANQLDATGTEDVFTYTTILRILDVSSALEHGPGDLLDTPTEEKRNAHFDVDGPGQWAKFFGPLRNIKALINKATSSSVKSTPVHHIPSSLSSNLDVFKECLQDVERIKGACNIFRNLLIAGAHLRLILSTDFANTAILPHYLSSENDFLGLGPHVKTDHAARMPLFVAATISPIWLLSVSNILKWHAKRLDMLLYINDLPKLKPQRIVKIELIIWQALFKMAMGQGHPRSCCEELLGELKVFVDGQPALDDIAAWFDTKPFYVQTLKTPPTTPANASILRRVQANESSVSVVAALQTQQSSTGTGDVLPVLDGANNAVVVQEATVHSDRSSSVQRATPLFLPSSSGSTPQSDLMDTLMADVAIIGQDVRALAQRNSIPVGASVPESVEGDGDVLEFGRIQLGLLARSRPLGLDLRGSVSPDSGPRDLDPMSASRAPSSQGSQETYRGQGHPEQEHMELGGNKHDNRREHDELGDPEQDEEQEHAKQKANERDDDEERGEQGVVEEDEEQRADESSDEQHNVEGDEDSDDDDDDSVDRDPSQEDDDNIKRPSLDDNPEDDNQGPSQSEQEQEKPKKAPKKRKRSRRTRKKVPPKERVQKNTLKSITLLDRPLSSRDTSSPEVPINGNKRPLEEEALSCRLVVSLSPENLEHLEKAVSALRNGVTYDDAAEEIQDIPKFSYKEPLSAGTRTKVKLRLQNIENDDKTDADPFQVSTLFSQWAAAESTLIDKYGPGNSHFEIASYDRHPSADECQEFLRSSHMILKHEQEALPFSDACRALHDIDPCMLIPIQVLTSDIRTVVQSVSIARILECAAMRIPPPIQTVYPQLVEHKGPKDFFSDHTAWKMTRQTFITRSSELFPWNRVSRALLSLPSYFDAPKLTSGGRATWYATPRIPEYVPPSGPDFDVLAVRLVPGEDLVIMPENCHIPALDTCSGIVEMLSAISLGLSLVLFEPDAYKDIGPLQLGDGGNEALPCLSASKLDEYAYIRGICYQLLEYVMANYVVTQETVPVTFINICSVIGIWLAQVHHFLSVARAESPVVVDLDKFSLIIQDLFQNKPGHDIYVFFDSRRDAYVNCTLDKIHIVPVHGVWASRSVEMGKAGQLDVKSDEEILLSGRSNQEKHLLNIQNHRVKRARRR